MNPEGGPESCSKDELLPLMQNMEAWVWTSATAWQWQRSWATSAAEASPWPSASRRTWPRLHWPGTRLHQLLLEPACTGVRLHAVCSKCRVTVPLCVFCVQVWFRGAKAAVPPALHSRGRGGLSWRQRGWSRLRRLKCVCLFYRSDPSCLRGQRRVSAVSSWPSAQVSPPRR